ncbi:substrate-binding domain-containing protein [Sporomusa ovata]|uniref:substrate-binding domain-containing protein n=1 Tax=Sporomusa ovata TaxID=2378 RepID=UPI000594738F|nr:substrate-binding domain-containing protein [Sporomusa ovata]
MKLYQLLGIFIITLTFGLTGCSSEKPALPAGNDNSAPTPIAQDTDRFIVAGSGTNLPITMKLAEAYKRKNNINIEVPNSIGSDGAVKAVQDGTLKLGLMSRPLTDEEKAVGLHQSISINNCMATC